MKLYCPVCDKHNVPVVLGKCQMACYYCGREYLMKDDETISSSATDPQPTKHTKENNMALTISESLAKLKNLKSKLARVEKYVSASVVHYEDETPEYNFAAESAERETLLLAIRKLKAKIQETNSATKVTFDGQQISLTELILVNADLRSELAYTQKQLDLSTNEGGHWNKRTREDIKKKFAEGYDKPELRKKVADLEAKKEEIEGLLNSTNLTTKLVEA